MVVGTILEGIQVYTLSRKQEEWKHVIVKTKYYIWIVLTLFSYLNNPFQKQDDGNIVCLKKTRENFFQMRDQR